MVGRARVRSRRSCRARDIFRRALPHTAHRSRRRALNRWANAPARTSTARWPAAPPPPPCDPRDTPKSHAQVLTHPSPRARARSARTPRMNCGSTASRSLSGFRPADRAVCIGWDAAELSLVAEPAASRTPLHPHRAPPPTPPPRARSPHRWRGSSRRRPWRSLSSTVRRSCSSSAKTTVKTHRRCDGEPWEVWGEASSQSDHLRQLEIC